MPQTGIAQTERPPLGWRLEFDNCVQSVGELNKKLGEMEDRLHSIMTPEQSAIAKTPTEPQPVTSPLVAAILEHNEALRMLIQRVNDITRRIV